MFHVFHIVTHIYESNNSRIHPIPKKIKFYTKTNYVHNKLFKLNTSQVNLSSVSQKKKKKVNLSCKEKHQRLCRLPKIMQTTMVAKSREGKKNCAGYFSELMQDRLGVRCLAIREAL